MKLSIPYTLLFGVAVLPSLVAGDGKDVSEVTFCSEWLFDKNEWKTSDKCTTTKDVWESYCYHTDQHAGFSWKVTHGPMWCYVYIDFLCKNLPKEFNTHFSRPDNKDIKEDVKSFACIKRSESPCIVM